MDEECRDVSAIGLVDDRVVAVGRGVAELRDQLAAAVQRIEALESEVRTLRRWAAGDVSDVGRG